MADSEDRRAILGEEDEDPADSGPGRPMPAICDPRHILHRVVVLGFMCFLGFGERRRQIRPFPQTNRKEPSRCQLRLSCCCCFVSLKRKKPKMLYWETETVSWCVYCGDMVYCFTHPRELLLLWQPSFSSNSSHQGISHVRMFILFNKHLIFSHESCWFVFCGKSVTSIYSTTQYCVPI